MRAAVEEANKAYKQRGSRVPARCELSVWGRRATNVFRLRLLRRGDRGRALAGLTPSERAKWLAYADNNEEDIAQAIEDGSFIDSRVLYADRELLTTAIRDRLQVMDLFLEHKEPVDKVHPWAGFLAWVETTFARRMDITRALTACMRDDDQCLQLSPTWSVVFKYRGHEEPFVEATLDDDSTTRYYALYARAERMREAELRRLLIDVSEGVRRLPPAADDNTADMEAWLAKHPGPGRLVPGTYAEAPFVVVEDVRYEVYDVDETKRANARREMKAHVRSLIHG